jgi:hypothetical protein
MTAKAQGALFRNKDRQGSQPEYRGDFKMTQELLDELAVAFGTGHDKVQLAAWVKEDKNGNKYFSLSVQPPYRKEGQNAQPQRPQSRPASRATELDDDVPF